MEYSDAWYNSQRQHKQAIIIIIITRNTFCRTSSLSDVTLSFLITWRSSSSKSAAVYKISSKSDDFSLRYGDISIFKMAAVRHLGIVLPPYETTHEVSVTGRSCLTNFMSIWYTDLKIQLFEFFAYSDFWINPDPDVCQICPEMRWMDIAYRRCRFWLWHATLRLRSAIRWHYGPQNRPK